MQETDYCYYFATILDNNIYFIFLLAMNPLKAHLNFISY